MHDTGVSIPLGHNAIYTFHGPSYNEHVDILSSLFVALNDRDITDFGLQRSDLQAHVSSQQTIGQYIRTIREELVRQNTQFLQRIKSYSYKPFTVVMCFVNPLPAYRTEPIIKGMTINAFGKIRTGEILRVTQSQKAQKWQSKRQALANIVEALDIRVVEVAPEIITKLLYAYGWQKSLSSDYNEDTRTLIENYLNEQEIDYNAPKSVRQNLRQQLRATNLFRIIAGEETRGHPTPNFLRQDELSKQEQTRRNAEYAEITLTKFACEKSHNRQQELHSMFALAIEDLLQNSGNISTVSDFKGVYPEAWLTLTDFRGTQKKYIRPDVVVEMQDSLYLLEFCWRSEEHFTYADIASYVLRKIQESYLNLPLIQALAEN